MNDNRMFISNKSVLLNLLNMGMPSIFITLYFNISSATTSHWINRLREDNEWEGKIPSFIEAIPAMLKLLAHCTFLSRELLPWMDTRAVSYHMKISLNKIFETERIIEILDSVIPHIKKMQLFSFNDNVPQGYRKILNELSSYKEWYDSNTTGLSLWREYLRKIADGGEVNIVVKKRKDLQKSITGQILDELITSIRGNIKSVLTVAICKNINEIVLPTLTEKEMTVLKMYYGLDEPALTIDEIAKKLDLTWERTRQIKEKALRRLHHTSRMNLIFEPIPSESMMFMLKSLKTPTEVEESKKHRIVDLDFSVRALVVLKTIGIIFLEDIMKYSREDLLRFRNMGKKSMTEIEEMMKKYNLSFL